MFAVIVYRDGEPLTGPMPIDDHDAAHLGAQLLVGLGLRRVSVGDAVFRYRTALELERERAEADPTIFDALEATHA